MPSTWTSVPTTLQFALGDKVHAVKPNSLFTLYLSHPPSFIAVQLVCKNVYIINVYNLVSLDTRIHSYYTLLSTPSCVKHPLPLTVSVLLLFFTRRLKCSLCSSRLFRLSHLAFLLQRLKLRLGLTRFLEAEIKSSLISAFIHHLQVVRLPRARHCRDLKQRTFP